MFSAEWIEMKIPTEKVVVVIVREGVFIEQICFYPIVKTKRTTN